MLGRYAHVGHEERAGHPVHLHRDAARFWRGSHDALAAGRGDGGAEAESEAGPGGGEELRETVPTVPSVRFPHSSACGPLLCGRLRTVGENRDRPRRNRPPSGSGPDSEGVEVVCGRSRAFLFFRGLPELPEAGAVPARALAGAVDPHLAQRGRRAGDGRRERAWGARPAVGQPPLLVVLPVQQREPVEEFARRAREEHRPGLWRRVVSERADQRRDGVGVEGRLHQLALGTVEGLQERARWEGERPGVLARDDPPRGVCEAWEPVRVRVRET